MQTLGEFFEKKSWSQMIQKCLIRGSGGNVAVSSVFRVEQFNSENILKN